MESKDNAEDTLQNENKIAVVFQQGCSNESWGSSQGSIGYSANASLSKLL